MIRPLCLEQLGSSQVSLFIGFIKVNESGTPVGAKHTIQVRYTCKYQSLYILDEIVSIFIEIGLDPPSTLPAITVIV